MIDMMEIGFRVIKCTLVTQRAQKWAIREGLSIAWNMGHRHIIMEIDSLIVVNMLTTNNVCMQGRSQEFSLGWVSFKFKL